MKKEEFESLRGELKSFVKETILTEKENIFGEQVEYSFVQNFTSKDKNQLRNLYEENLFVESITFETQKLLIKFKDWVNARDLREYVKNMKDFSETLFPSHYVFDENKSVKWNRELVEEENKAIKNRKALDMKERKILKNSMKRAIILGVIDFYKLKKKEYEAVETVYEYLRGTNASDEEIDKNIYPFMETIFNYNKMAKKAEKK